MEWSADERELDKELDEKEGEIREMLKLRPKVDAALISEAKQQVRQAERMQSAKSSAVAVELEPSTT